MNQPGCGGKSDLILLDFLVGRQRQRLFRHGFAHINSTAQVGQITDFLAGFELAGDLQQRIFAHAIDQQVGLAVGQQGTPYFVAPIIIMGQTSQTGFDPADHDRHARPGLADQVGINDAGSIWTQPSLSAG